MANSIHIHSDPQTRYLYANDASMYEELPRGVAFPENGEEIRELIRKAHRESFSIVPRSAGTSLAGQATGDGVVMDVSRHMTDIRELNAEKRYARVEPGVIRDTLNRKAGRENLVFGPDTATTNRCMLGGMIGNNSCGSFSIKHGTTRDHILEIDAVLSDGSRARFEPLTSEELEKKKQLDSLEGRIYRGMVDLIGKYRDAILEAYPHPDIIRRNTGYPLDALCSMQPFEPDGEPFNLAKLLCGSEGTLAITTSAKVKLVPVDPHKILIVPHFETLDEALKAAVEAVALEPAAVELVDDTILDATKDNIEQRKNRFFLEGEPRAILIIQFDGREPDLLRNKCHKLKKIYREKNLAYAAPVIEENEQIDSVWNLRKAGLGLLMGLGSDSRSPSFCEDTAVRVEDLPSYVEEFQEILKKHDTDCIYYAHASVGELHLRPVIDTQKPEGIQKMNAMAEEIAELVEKYGGSLSGEHGDGRARSPYIEKVLGKEMIPLLQQVKELWDPNYLLNPGKIVHPKKIDEDLRFSPSYDKPDVETAFHWRKEGGFGNALELCNGAGVCRKTAESGGTMCPSYMATRNEKDSTRGRANLLRQLFASKRHEAFRSEEIRDALDLCLSCKACKSECPANVDMARMKAEFMQGWHDMKGASLSERFFGDAGRFYPLASLLHPLTNRFTKSKTGKKLLHQFLNIDPRRRLPEFAAEPFIKWYRDRVDGNSSSRKIVLAVDIFTNHHDPRIAKAACRLFRKFDYEVIVPGCIESGRTQLSKGFVNKAKKLAEKNVDMLTPYVKEGIPVVGLEPSEILTFRDEYPDLVGKDLLKEARDLSANSYPFEEFVQEFLSDEWSSQMKKGGEKVYIHGHCHTKALTGMEPLLKMFGTAGYEPVDLETGCCGMAGSFGYEDGHYEVSMDIGELVLFPSLDELEDDAIICAPGFSCRHQIKDGTGRRAYHPAELLTKLF